MQNETASETGEMRAWTRFACRFMFCFVVLFALAHLVGPQLVKYSDSLPTQTLRAQIQLISSLDSNSRTTDVVILGDSTATRTLVAREIEAQLVGTNAPYRTVSYAVAFGTLTNSYTLLLRHLQHQQLPRCIVVMTSYGAASQHYGDTFWREMVGPNLFTYDELMALYSWSAQAGDFPSTAHSPINFRASLAHHALLNGFNLSRLRRFLFFPNSQGVSADYFNYALTEHGSFPYPKHYRFRATSPDFHAYLKRPYRKEPLIDLILTKIADLNTRVILISNPLAEGFNSVPVKRWTEAHQQHMSELLSSKKNVMLSMTPSLLPDRYFIDPTHPFADGAHVLQGQYINEIQHCLDQ